MGVLRVRVATKGEQATPEQNSYDTGLPHSMVSGITIEVDFVGNVDMLNRRRRRVPSEWRLFLDVYHAGYQSSSRFVAIFYTTLAHAYFTRPT